MKKFKQWVSCSMAVLMLMGSFVGSQKIIEDKQISMCPNAIIAVVATGGALGAALPAGGGAAMAALGIDAVELTAIFEAAAAGASKATLMAMFGAAFGTWLLIAGGMAIIA